MDQSLSGGALATPLPWNEHAKRRRRSAPSSTVAEPLVHSQNSLTYSVDTTTTNSNSVVRMSVVLQPSSQERNRRGSGYVSAVSSDEEYIDKSERSDDSTSDRSSFSLHRMDQSGLLVIGNLPSPSSNKPKSQLKMSQKRKDLLRKVSSKNKNKKNQTKKKPTPPEKKSQHPESSSTNKDSSPVSDDSTIQAFRAIDEQQSAKRKLSMQVKEHNPSSSRRLSSSKHHVNDPSVPSPRPRRNSLGSSLSKLQSQPPQPPIRGSSVDSPRSLRRKSLSAVLTVDEKDALDGSVHTKTSHSQHTSRRPSLNKFFSVEPETTAKQPRRSSATSVGSYERRRSRSQPQRKEDASVSASGRRSSTSSLGTFLLTERDKASSTTRPKRASTASSLGSYERRRSAVERTNKKHMTGDSSSASTRSSSRSTVSSSSSSASTGSASDDTSNQPSIMERLDGVWNSSSSSTTTSRRRNSTTTPSKARGRRSIRSASPVASHSRLQGRRIRSPHRRNYHSSQSPLRSTKHTTSSTERVSISALVQQCAIHNLEDETTETVQQAEVKVSTSTHHTRLSNQKGADSVSQRSASSTRLSSSILSKDFSTVAVVVDPLAKTVRVSNRSTIPLPPPSRGRSSTRNSSTTTVGPPRPSSPQVRRLSDHFQRTATQKEDSDDSSQDDSYFQSPQNRRKTFVLHQSLNKLEESDEGSSSSSSIPPPTATATPKPTTPSLDDHLLSSSLSQLSLRSIGMDIFGMNLDDCASSRSGTTSASGQQVMKAVLPPPPPLLLSPEEASSSCSSE